MNLEKDLLKKIYNLLFFSDIEKKLFQRFNLNQKPKKSDQPILLVQCVEDYFYYGYFGQIILSLKEKKDINVEQYVIRSLTQSSSTSITMFLKSILYSSGLSDKKWTKLYSSYCDRIAYKHTNGLNIIDDIKAFYRAYKIYKNLTTKENLLSLIIENIYVGDLIYDTYLKYKPSPTVNFNDFYLLIVIWQSIRNITITNNYFRFKNPVILLTSYSSYIHHGIAVRIAVHHGTKVFSFGNNQSLTKELTTDDWFHPPKNASYRNDFNELQQKEVCLEKARVALENRLSGAKDPATYYMIESAYKKSDVDVPYLKDHVIVFLHDFYDSPHVYGNGVFIDFLEWAETTIAFLEKMNIPYYLKPHPNQIYDSTKVIEMLKKKYPKSKFLSSKITNKQLVDAEIKVGISVYGTVGHELVYMGVPMILCGPNPHSSYDFCFEAKTKEEYFDLIKNYKNLSVKQNYKHEVESFYYMHYCNTTDDMKKLMLETISLRQLNLFTDSNNGYNKYLELLASISYNKEFQKFILNLADKF